MANSSFYSGTGTNPTDVDSITSSKTAAETAATNAATSEANAALSAVSASNSATDASNSASSISGSVAAAASSATDSANSATSSATSATEAANSASSASTSATSASTSATSATSSASSAADSALDASGSATQAAASAASASTSASNAATSEVNSATSAAQAAASATTAQVAAANTAVSTVSANVAYVQSVADNISDVETVSNNVLKINTVADNVSAILAANSSSTQAVSSAAEAASSATQAAASATSAATSASTATAAKDAALEALDNFDDRYLGQKASDPSIDNDGNALVAGALYFNTTDNTMKVYDGSIWVAAYASLSGALIATNNLSDVTDAATSRTNLGLGTAATTASTDYATAAQGTLADTSVQPNDSPTFGSITVTGTVDGRDVAADGTKLDGIEALADVTDTANVTAAGALMDSELTSEASVKALDQGVATTDSPTFAALGVNGTVTADGLTVDGNAPAITFNDTNDVDGDFYAKVNTGAFRIQSVTDLAVATERLKIANNGDISFYEDTGTTAKFFWDASAESLGIGTSSPSSKLHISGTYDTILDGNSVQFTRAGPSYIQNNTAGGYTVFQQASGEAMRIDSSGNVLIGGTTVATSSGGLNVEISSSGSTVSPLTLQNQSTGNGSGVYLTFRGQRNTGAQSDYTYIQSVADDTTAGNGSMRFHTLGGGTIAERMRIDSSGNVGIGTSSPTTKLQSKGGSIATLTDNAGLIANASASFVVDHGNDYGLYTGYIAAAGDAIGIAATRTLGSALPLSLQPFGGNVGIGTSSPSDVLHLGGSSNQQIRINSSKNPAYVGAFADQLNLAINRRTSDGAIQNTDRSVAYISLNGPTGGSTISFSTAAAINTQPSERMRIDSSGNVGIGTSSPSAKLHVSGGMMRNDLGSSGTSLTLTGTGSNFQVNHAVSGYATLLNSGGGLAFNTLGTERMRIDSSGNLLVGTTSNAPTTTAGINLGSNNKLHATRSSGASAYFNRLTSDGGIVEFAKDGTTVGNIGSYFTNSVRYLYIAGASPQECGIGFYANGIYPSTATGSFADNSKDLGVSSIRWDDIYATNGTIQTSDRNEKQDIAELSDAEQRVAVAAKGLLRKFRWRDAVEEKGDEARTHFGIIAQDLQAAFAAEGLDAGDYAMFIHSTWTDEETGEERSRMGVRYSELLAFIIAAI